MLTALAAKHNRQARARRRPRSRWVTGAHALGVVDVPLLPDDGRRPSSSSLTASARPPDDEQPGAIGEPEDTIPPNPQSPSDVPDTSDPATPSAT